MAEEVIKTTSCCNDAMMGGLLGADDGQNGGSCRELAEG